MFNRSRLILAVSLVGICMGFGSAQAYSPTKQKFIYSSAAGEPAETAKRAYDLNQVSVLSPYPATGFPPAEWLRIERQSHGEVRVTGAFSRGGTITQLDLNLRPHSVRSVDYQLVIQQLDGSLAAVEPGPETTLRGTGTATSTTAPDPPSTPVAVTVVGSLLTDNRFYGRIILPAGDSYWIEPLEERFQAIPVEAAGSHVLYHSYDIKNSYPTEADKSEIEPVILPKEGELCYAQLAVETDCEYFVAHARSKATDETLVREGAMEVEAQVALVVNLLNIPYENQVGEPPTHLDISHRLTAVVVRPVRVDESQEPIDHLNQDPYEELNYEFRGNTVQSVWEPRATEKNSNPVLTEPLLYLESSRAPYPGEPHVIHRDAVQLLSGLDLGGGNAGDGTMGTDENVSAIRSDCGYSSVASVMQFGRYMSLSQRVHVSAHELGHNWNAKHSSGLQPPPPNDDHPWVMGATRDYFTFHPGNKQRILAEKSADADWFDCYEHNFHYFLEPEDGQLGGSASVEATNDGYGGKGFVRLEQASASVTIQLSDQRTVGNHYMFLRYANDSTADVGVRIQDNANSIGAYEVSLSPTGGAWKTVRLGVSLTETLAPSANTLRLIVTSGEGLLVDQIQLLRPRAKVGDTDGDDDVDSIDQSTLIANYTGADGNGKVWAEGDFDQDGDIDSVDSMNQLNGWTGALTPVPLVVITAIDEQAAESPQNVGQFVIMAIPASTIVVNVSVDGQADIGSDFVIEGGEFNGSTGTIEIGDNGVQVITIRPIDDSDAEGLEKISISLDEDSQYVIGPWSSANIHMASDEILPEVNIVAVDRYATENGDDGKSLHQARFELTVTPAPTNSLSVTVSQQSTAFESDFSLTGLNNGTVSVGPTGTATVTLSAIDDTEQEDVETVSLTVVPSAAYSTGARHVDTATIIDDDRPWSVSVTPVSPYDTTVDSGGKGGIIEAYETATNPQTPTDLAEVRRPGQFRVTSTRIPAPEFQITTAYSGQAVLDVGDLTKTDYEPMVSTVWDANHQSVSGQMPASGMLFITIWPRKDDLDEGNEGETVIVTTGSAQESRSPSATIWIFDRDAK